ncbi:MAG: hypothetical protein M3328_16635 [Chloroflexota bacterium]|nr:hypothetical protein [Chloroflexota bacterium]
MKVGHKNRASSWLAVLALLVSSAGVYAAPSQQAGGPFANPEFQNLWRRTDELPLHTAVRRGYFWGPGPLTYPLVEQWVGAPNNGKILVQYFDKSRMEIFNPAADKSNRFYVTNGLLADELIRGRIRMSSDGKYMEWFPARIPLASDPDDPAAPTYETFRSLVAAGTGPKVGQIVAEDVKAGPARTTPPAPSGDSARYAEYGVKQAYYGENGHNIPDVFWDFLNSTGPVLPERSDTAVVARLHDPWFYATGYPITEAYWASVKIAGQPGTDVLIQAYERRVLTYVPSAPDGFQVQMGNIGQHYYEWRYGAGKPQPILTMPEPLSTCTGNRKPAGDLGKMWAGDLVLQNRLGCQATSYDMNVTVQHFERGHMVYISANDTPPSLGTPGGIFVLFDDGTVKRYNDLRDPSAPEPTPESSPRGTAPQLGFGKVWRENKEVRDRLGYAISMEYPVREKPGYLFFQKGLMIVYGYGSLTLYAGGDFRFDNINSWTLHTGYYANYSGGD